VAQKLGLKPPPLDSTAEEVLVHLFLLRKAPNHFASSEMRRYATLRGTRLLVTQLSVAILVVSIGWAGWNVSRVFRASVADQRVTQQLNAFDRESEEITRSLPSFGVGGATMRDAVTFYNGSIRGFPMLEDFVKPVSQVLRSYPGVRLTQLSWLATDDPKATPRMALTQSRTAPPVRSIAKSGDAPAQLLPEESVNPTFAGGRYEVALVEATVRVASNDFRGATSEVERLAADIGKVAGFHADVVESPLDVNPSLGLQGRLADREPAVMEPRFVLRIVREKRPAA
jgi:hypothetical protein